MGFFRTKVDFEDLWVGCIGDLLQPSIEVYTIEILFPDLKYTTKKNSPKTVLAENDFIMHEFLSLKRALAVSAVASLASWTTPNQFLRFELIASNTDLSSDLSQFFDVQDFVSGLIRAINKHETIHLPGGVSEGSEVYGRRETASGDQLQIYDTANISLSYFISFFSSHSESFNSALNSDPAKSRDTIIDFFAYAVRYWNNLNREYKPQ